MVVRCWTVQPKSVWNDLNKKGIFQPDRRYILDKNFNFAYQWICDQAKIKISGWKTNRPVWFWMERPDLRSYRFIRDRRKKSVEDYVLIECLVDIREVICVDFEDWHFVLNNMYLSKKPSDWKRRWSAHQIRDSWKKIIKNPLKIKKKSQLIKEVIKRNEVVSVKNFKMINLI